MAQFKFIEDIIEGSLSLDTIICGNCIDVMARFPPESIDLVVTSPPYDDARTYDGTFDSSKFDYRGIIDQLYRVVKPAGVVVWVTNNCSEDASETLTSFEHARYFRKVGFNLTRTLIFGKIGCPRCGDNKLPNPEHEYMFCFCKTYPKKCDIPQDRPNRSAGRETGGGSKRGKDGKLRKSKSRIVPEYGKRGSIWYYGVGNNQNTKDEVAREHPAIFPEDLARDHVKCWSDPGDIVLDPMNGAGTTTKIARMLGRRFIGIDIVKKYCKIALRRMPDARLDDLDRKDTRRQYFRVN